MGARRRSPRPRSGALPSSPASPSARATQALPLRFALAPPAQDRPLLQDYGALRAAAVRPVGGTSAVRPAPRPCGPCVANLARCARHDPPFRRAPPPAAAPRSLVWPRGSERGPWRRRARRAPGPWRAAASLLLELRDSRLRHVLVLLRCPAANPARALDHAVLDDRHGAHTRDHVAALGSDDALDDRRAGALGQLAAGAPEGGRGDGLAL